MKNRNEKEEDKNLQITSRDFLIYRNANDDVKVEVLLINNDIIIPISIKAITVFFFILSTLILTIISC